MFRIRRITGVERERDRAVIGQVQEMLKGHFSLVSRKEIGALPDLLHDPLKHSLSYTLFVADGSQNKVKGFALCAYAPDVKFYYLDYLVADAGLKGRGVGGAIYERVRAEARALKVVGLFMECLPDDPGLCMDPAELKQNIARLRFYETFGARPIVNTAYETPLTPGSDCPPYLVFDGLDGDGILRMRQARRIVKAICERKYRDLCSPAYVKKVVASFRDDPVEIRPPKYVKKPVRKFRFGRLSDRIALVINPEHAIHHVHERGYVEAPVRIRSITKEIDKMGVFDAFEPKTFPQLHLRRTHDPKLVDYLRRVCQKVEPANSVYPYVFPIRNPAKPPHSLPVRAGYFCFDTFTPLNRLAYTAARRAVDCALTAAETLFGEHMLAYALVRPPGHHAERKVFGGFCYFNSAAIAAAHLSEFGRVAVLDVDYHHGNGTQDIFYDRDDVLTVSIHGHPSFAFPYFSGFKDETGEGAGGGFNLNIPLGESVDGAKYAKALARALERVKTFKPDYLIVSLGLDTARGDPTGSWSLTAEDFENNGHAIGGLGLPTLVVQEGGYRIRTLGLNARMFFTGLLKGFRKTT